MSGCCLLLALWPSATITYALLASYEGINVHEYGECDYFVCSFSVLSGRAGYAVNIFSPMVISTRQIRTLTVAQRRSQRMVALVFRVIRGQSLLGRKDVGQYSACCRARQRLRVYYYRIFILFPRLLPPEALRGYVYDYRLYFLFPHYLWFCTLVVVMYLQSNNLKRRDFYMYYVSCFTRDGITSSGGPWP